MAQAFQWIVANYADLLVAINALLAALILVFTMIPGEQPEKAMKAIVDFIARFSRK